MIFTTSWDDGYKADLRIAELLNHYGCKGTFYVCPHKQHGQELLSEEDIRTLQKHHEIGAHTLHHPRLTGISKTEARSEIEESKKWVEDITNQQCKMFCYPYGDWSTEIASLVKKSGFTGARTTERLELCTAEPYSMPTTVQVAPFPKRKTCSKWWHPLDPLGPVRVRYRKLRKIGITYSQMRSWLDCSIAIFDKAKSMDTQTVFHLWGHSHEIQRYGMWNEFEMFLKHVQESNVHCVVNSEAL